MVPGLLALHLWGPVAGFVIAASGPAILAARLRRRIGAAETLKSAVTSQCDIGWHLHPAFTLTCGISFFALALWGVATATRRGAMINDQGMTPFEQSWLGAVFMLVGTGVCLAAASSWLARDSLPADVKETGHHAEKGVRNR